MGQALSLTYGRFFAEFLEDLSLVRLTLLELNTCVGFRYGRHVLKLRSFSWNRALYSFPLRRRELCHYIGVNAYRISLVRLLIAPTQIR